MSKILTHARVKWVPEDILVLGILVIIGALNPEKLGEVVQYLKFPAGFLSGAYCAHIFSRTLGESAEVTV